MKEELISILQSFVRQPITQITIHNLYESLDIFFDKYDLKDIQYKIDYNTDLTMINIVGIRPIDKLAILALTSK